MDVCTIISRNEWARARALAASVRKYHPEARCKVLVLDHDGAVTPDEGVEIVTVDDLGLSDAGLLPALLDRELLREALVPALLRNALGGGAEVALFAYPGTRLYAPLEGFVEQAVKGGLVLTPVLANPIPDDGAEPDRAALESWGAFDPGLIGASRDEGVLEMLDWWARGVTALPEISSMDASAHVSWWYDFEPTLPSIGDPAPRRSSRVWLDLATGLVPRLEVNRDPGCNAAYWNLHGRRLEANGNAFTVDGAPLRSFQFRWFDPTHPRLLSLGQSRISLADEPGLRLLCERYAAELFELGEEEVSGTPYGLGSLPDGTELDFRMRKLVREAVARGAVTDSIFTDLGQGQLLSWLREPGFAGAPPELNRYMLQIYKDRADVQRVLPSSDPDFATRLVEWLRVSGVHEEHVPDSVCPPALEGSIQRQADSASRPRSRRRAVPAASLGGPSDAWGVNVVGFMRSDFGIAHAARLAIEALDTARVPLIPIHDLSLARFKTEGSRYATLGTGAAGFPISLLVMNGDHIGRFREEVPASFFEDRYTIAMWFWETDRIPDAWMPSLEVLDEIWVASRYVGETVARDTSLPVTDVGLPVSVPAVDPPDRAELGVGEGDFLFLYLFDFGSVGERKNPLGVLNAFTRAFEPGSGAKLLLKSSYSVYAENDFVELKLAAAEHPDVVIDDGRVPTDRKNAILAACDCYVSLHRSEGFGLSQAEAMYLGKPLISTAYGGVLEFATPENSYPVDCRLVEVGEGHAPYGESDRWAEPDLDQAAELMRWVFENRDEARERGAKGAASIRSGHSAEAVARRMDARLTRIRRMLRSEMAISPEVPADPSAPPPARWARLRTRIRLRTRLRAILRRVRGATHEPPDGGVSGREQELREAAVAAQLLEQVRGVDRAIQRLGSLGPHGR